MKTDSFFTASQQERDELLSVLLASAQEADRNAGGGTALRELDEMIAQLMCTALARPEEVGKRDAIIEKLLSFQERLRAVRNSPSEHHHEKRRKTGPCAQSTDFGTVVRDLTGFLKLTPLPKWITKEYQNEKALIRKNLELLMPLFPGSFVVSIRGDGDCTFRAIAVALLLGYGRKELQDALCIVVHTVMEEIVEDEELFRTQIARLKQYFLDMSEDMIGLLDRYPVKYPDNDIQEALRLMQDEYLERLFIQYLRAFSSLHVALHRDRLPESCRLMLITEAAESDVSEYLYDKGTAVQPNDASLFGNIVDAWALGNLFQIPIDWIRVESAYRMPQPEVLSLHPNHSKKIFLLNRPGHTDLLLTPSCFLPSKNKQH